MTSSELKDTVKGKRIYLKIWYDKKQYCFKLEASTPALLHWVRDEGLSGTAIGD